MSSPRSPKININERGIDMDSKYEWSLGLSELVSLKQIPKKCLEEMDIFTDIWSAFLQCR